MPVATECLDLFIRYEALVDKFPGGAEGFHEHCLNSIGLWHDRHIIRMGAMDPMGLNLMKDSLREIGLREHRDFGTDETWLNTSPEGCPEGYVALMGHVKGIPIIDASNFHQFLEGKLT